MYTFKASGYGVDPARINGEVLNRLAERYREVVEPSRFNDPTVAKNASPLYPPEQRALYNLGARKGAKATSYVLLSLKPGTSEHLMVNDVDSLYGDEVLVAYSGDNSFVRVQRRDSPVSLDYIEGLFNRQLSFKKWTAVRTERGTERGREEYLVADITSQDSVDFRALDRVSVTLRSVTLGNGIQMEGQYGPLFRGMSSPVGVSLAPVQTGAYSDDRKREDVALVTTTQWRTTDHLGALSNNLHIQLLAQGRSLEVPGTLVVGTFYDVDGRVRLFTPDTDLSKVVAAEVTSTDSRTLASSEALVDFYRQLVGSPKPGPTYAQGLLDAMEAQHRAFARRKQRDELTDEYEIDKFHNLSRMIQELTKG